MGLEGKVRLGYGMREPQGKPGAGSWKQAMEAVVYHEALSLKGSSRRVGPGEELGG